MGLKEEANASAHCEAATDLRSMLTVMSECDVTLEEVISSLIGLMAGPIWLVGHFLIFSVNHKRSSSGSSSRGLPAWVTWCLLPHCVADVISCVGAVLAMQLFPQIVFAVLVSSGHVAVALVIVLRHFSSSTRQYDLHGDSLVNTGAGCTVPPCCGYPLTFCTRLSLLVIVTLTWGADVTALSDVTKIRGAPPYDAELWREIIGVTLGVAACLGHWIASLYEVVAMCQERSGRVERQEWTGVAMRMVGNGQYLVTVLWRPRLTARLTALPWTVCRGGLLGINFGMVLQLWRKARRHTADDVSAASEKADESLLSACSTASGGDSHVLWDSCWTHKQGKEPALYPGMPLCLDQGRSARAVRTSAVYDLLPSTDTSCSPSVDPDTEVELENTSQIQTQAGCGGRLHSAPDLPLARFSPLTPEARQARVWRWVAKSGPDDDDDDDGHVTEVAVAEHAQSRQHSGSFSHGRSAGSPSCTGPKHRKNSAIF